MVAGLHPVVVFWTGWGIHVTVLVSFTVQVTLLLLADIRRRRDWAMIKVVIWSAYTLADTAAIYALGHMAVVCRSPEHHLVALWAPLLLVHLGGQDNITAYAIEDNRLWLRHLQTFVLQVIAAGYVLYVSSIVSHPSKLRSAAILMFVVGVLKYGERIWALKRANSCASSSLSATSYGKVSVYRPAESNFAGAIINRRNSHQIIAYFWLDVPKKMFEGPTSYVQVNNEDNMVCEAEFMFRVAEVQLSMMYDLLYTKAAVVHTWYGFCSRVLISLPSTVTALLLFRSSMSHHDKSDATTAAGRVDVSITNVLLIGAVVLEIMSVLRAIFSKWTAIFLNAKNWNTIGDMIFRVEAVVTGGKDALFTEGMDALFGTSRYRYWDWEHSKSYSWSGRMRQHGLFKLASHSDISIGSKMAKTMGVEDRWDSNVYSWSVDVPVLAITKVLQLVSITEDITKSQDLNAVRRCLNNQQVAAWICVGPELKLEERILVWHIIATHVYIEWYENHAATTKTYFANSMWTEGQSAVALANYMFFLLAARPYMLPYPVSRQAYVQLCSDALTHFRSYCNIDRLVSAILDQKENLMEGTPLEIQPDEDQEGTIGRQGKNGGETGAAAQPQHQPSMNNSILDRGCQLAAKLIHITATTSKQKENDESTIVIKRSPKKQGQQRVDDGNEDMVITKQAAKTFSVVDGEVIQNMLLRVWTEMLCYTAYLCNENYHAKHLTDGGEIMTIVTLMMIYMKNGLLRTINASTSGTAASTSSHGATDTDIDSVV